MSSLYDFEVLNNQDETVSLKHYEGKIVLIVNTASACGLTPQYKALQTLFDQYKEEGLVILAFPCNQFGGQEPGDDKTIAQFCESHFQVSFPLFKKIKVNGPDASPLFNFLKSSAPGLLGSEPIKWNFTKFLVDRSGQVIKRFAPTTSPEDIEPEIKALV